MTQPFRMLVVVRPGEDRASYLAALQERGVTCDVVESPFLELTALAKGKLYHGLLVDVATAAKAHDADKTFIAALVQTIPAARLRRVRGSDLISLQSYPGWQPLRNCVDDFVEACRTTEGRQVRCHHREAVYLNAEIAVSLGNDAVWHQTNSLDVSTGGCLLYLCDAFPSLPNELYVRFVELTDKTPIAVSVRSRIPWGSKGRLPGIGLQFLQPTDSQSREIMAIVDTAAKLAGR